MNPVDFLESNGCNLLDDVSFFFFFLFFINSDWSIFEENPMSGTGCT